MSLPPLPIPRHRSSQPANVVQADQTLRDIYRSAISVLSLPSIDPWRTEYHLQTIARDAVPLLITVEDSSGSSELKKWVYECAEEFGALCIRLAEAGAQPDEENPNIHFINPVTTVRTGKRGQPRKVIDPSYLCKAMNPKRRIPITVLAKALKVSTKTVTSSLKQNNINYKPSRISDRQLDDVVKTFQQKKPRSGEQYLTGYLRRSGLKVQRQRIRESVRRVDKLGHALRLQQKRKIERVPYMVSRPNALWHIDGHHKLILWGIVIHGCVDGFSRKVTGLQASTDNRASTVLRMFSCAVNRYGWPSRVRGDRGGENRDVSVVMILHRGLRRGSFIWGSSTHNTRIERLWVEVGTQFVRAWRAFFFRLERRHYLDRKNPHHLWLLQFLFLDTINDDCKEFQKDWNAHPISDLGHGRSPNDLFFLGQLRHGIYKDDCEGCSPEEIARSYGVYGTPIHHHAHQTGAGHSSDEESESESDCEEWYGIDDETNSEFEYFPSRWLIPLATDTPSSSSTLPTSNATEEDNLRVNEIRKPDTLFYALQCLYHFLDDAIPNLPEQALQALPLVPNSLTDKVTMSFVKELFHTDHDLDLIWESAKLFLTRAQFDELVIRRVNTLKERVDNPQAASGVIVPTDCTPLTSTVLVPATFPVTPETPSPSKSSSALSKMPLVTTPNMSPSSPSNVQVDDQQLPRLSFAQRLARHNIPLPVARDNQTLSTPV
ncbi:hypothetical protein D9758_017251 [Tetrapyrgos nigripes]|uniref:Integrase catalytic domain-containing protein n=1 Tax=Tetrapyrgos nigripes TaxID=182062 RepID=A0A8H5C4P6_9AGAR|nr:hypothetical protein D9758_017251 [Tetrapyrgos nigripes]